MRATSGSNWTRTFVAAGLMLACGTALAADFTFTPNISGGFGHYRWDVSIAGAPVVQNPGITVYRGQTYTLDANTSAIHPFWIKTSPSTGSLNAYTGAELTGTNGTSAPATLTFAPNASTPDTLYYDCGNHFEMQGVITVITDVIFANGFE